MESGSQVSASWKYQLLYQSLTRVWSSIIFLELLTWFAFVLCCIPRTELEDAYGGDGMAVLDCKGKVHLSQVYLCMVPDSETGLPKQQVRRRHALRHLFML